MNRPRATRLIFGAAALGLSGLTLSLVSPGCTTTTGNPTATTTPAPTNTPNPTATPAATSTPTLPPNPGDVYVGYVNGVYGTIVVNSAVNTIVATLPVVGEMALTPNGSRLYVAGGPLSAFDTLTNGLVAAIPPGSYGFVTAHPGGARIYGSNWGIGSLVVADVLSNTVVATVSVPNSIRRPVCTPNGSWVYVPSSNASGSVLVLNAATNAIVATVPVGSFGCYADVAPNGSFVYVGNWGSTDVSVIQTSTQTVVATIPVSIPLVSIGVSPNGSFVYVGAYNALVRIDAATNTVGASTGLGGVYFSFTPNGSYLYVAASSLTVLDVATTAIVATLPISVGPVAVLPPGSTVYAAGNDIYAINTASNAIVATIPVGGVPYTIAVR